MNNGKKYYVKDFKEPVLKILESFNGDLYFITEELENGEILCYARLYSMPEFAEWGWNDINYLKSVYGKYKLWEVTPENWDNINTYEDGLLNQR